MKRVSGPFPHARSMAFVYLVAVITAVGSERMFWFWTPGLRSHLEVAAFYAIATATGIMLMRRHRVDSWWSLMLAVPVVAYVVEGVITPVLYSGGPFVPLFPAWFTMWHGIMSFAALVFVIRHLLLAEAIAKLSLLALGLGVLWGVWSTTQWLPESYADAELVAEYGTLQILDPGAFAGYAALFTAALLVAHGVIGLVWPTATPAPSGRLTRGERIVGALVLAGAGSGPWRCRGRCRCSSPMQACRSSRCVAIVPGSRPSGPTSSPSSRAGFGCGRWCPSFSSLRPPRSPTPGSGSSTPRRWCCAS